MRDEEKRLRSTLKGYTILIEAWEMLFKAVKAQVRMHQAPTEEEKRIAKSFAEMNGVEARVKMSLAAVFSTIRDIEDKPDEFSLALRRDINEFHRMLAEFDKGVFLTPPQDNL